MDTRRIVAIAVALIVAIGGAACGSSDEEQTQPDPVPATAEPDAPSPADFASGGGAPQPQSPSADAAAAPRPPDPARIALGLGDLPDGASIRFEGFVETEDEIVAFRRSLDTFDVQIGTSRILNLVNDVVLFESAEVALLALEQVRAELTERPGEFFRGAIEAGAGIGSSNFSGQTAAFPQLGDGTVTSLGFFDTAAGRGEGLFVAVRVGRFHNVMLTIAPQGVLDISDVGALVEVVNGRIRQSERPAGSPAEPGAPAPRRRPNRPKPAAGSQRPGGLSVSYGL